MNTHGVVIVIPMKRLHVAKSRLAERLTPEQRATLSLNMLLGVVGAALSSTAVRVWVAGSDEEMRLATSTLGVEWHRDQGDSLNDTLGRAFREAFALQLAPMYLPADLPFLTPQDVQEAIRASGDGSRLTLSPAHRDGGTNAIIVPPGAPFRLDLGVGSFQRHKAQAQALGLSAIICDLPNIGLDLDTADDLRAYEEKEPGLLNRLTQRAALPL